MTLHCIAFHFINVALIYSALQYIKVTLIDYSVFKVLKILTLQVDCAHDFVN